MFRALTITVRALVRPSAQQAQRPLALPMLREEIAAAARDVEKTRRAAGVLTAHAAREQVRLTQTQAQQADLEARTVAALEAGEEALAREAAQTLLHIEQDIAANQASVDIYAQEDRRLRELLRESESRLRALDRGVRVAQARTIGAPLQHTTATTEQGLEAAERRLTALQQQQEFDQAASAAVRALGKEAQVDAVRHKLAQAGFGPALQPGVEDVLSRLRARLDTPPHAPEAT